MYVILGLFLILSLFISNPTLYAAEIRDWELRGSSVVNDKMNLRSSVELNDKDIILSNRLNDPEASKNIVSENLYKKDNPINLSGLYINNQSIKKQTIVAKLNQGYDYTITNTTRNIDNNSISQKDNINHILDQQKILEQKEIKADFSSQSKYKYFSPIKGPKENLTSALIKAYNENPDLNQQRANLRVRDEDVPKAASGFHPKVTLNGNAGLQTTKVHTGSAIDPNSGTRTYLDDGYFSQPRGASFQISQLLFDGNRTRSAVNQAESGIFAVRAGLRFTEQNTLLKAVTAYMDVFRDAAIVRLKLNNIDVIEEQLKQTKLRYDNGDVTLTDYSQSEASLAQAKADYYIADSNLQVSIAAYQQVIGQPPGMLEPVRPVEQLLPKKIEDAVDAAIKQHPNVVGALHQVDAAQFGVKAAEGALLPTISFSSQVTQQNDWLLGLPGTRLFQAQAGVQLNVPIFSGGGEYASIRQAKEQRGQARLVVDQQRLAVRNDVYSSFARLNAAKEARKSGEVAVKAAEAALSGVRIEALVGQRTVQDVLNAQQALLDARVKLITYQHDIVVASYTALAAIGGLNKENLGLDTDTYNANKHYEQVKNKWIGLSTPSDIQ